jgi:hypothetical protein
VKRPIPRGYYAMTVGMLREFLKGQDDAKELRGELGDGQRFPIIKLTCDSDHLTLRVPPERREP